MFWFVGSEKLETRNPKLETATIQPLWKPPQPQSEQRWLIPWDSFFLFLLRLSEKLSSPNCIPPVQAIAMVLLPVIERLEQLELWNAWNLS